MVQGPAKMNWRASIQLALVAACLAIPTSLGAVEEKPGFRESGILIQDAIVQGRPVRCVVDTGGTNSTLDADICGLSVPQGSRTEKVKTNSSILEMQILDDVAVSFNGSPTAAISPLVFNLSVFEQLYSQKIGAVIGMDLLSNYVLSIVDGEPKIVASIHERFSRTSITHSTYPDRSKPQLPIQIPVYGTRNFLVDTGCNGYMTITKELAEALVRSKRAVLGMEQVCFEPDGRKSVRNIIIQEIDISGVIFRNVPASIGNTRCIGMGLLTQLDLAVDFHNRRVYLDTESSNSMSEFPLNASGIQFVYVSNEAIRVADIRDDSPASKADVHLGDELVTIDGKTPADLSLDDLEKLVSREGKSIHIELRRLGRVHDVDVTLKRNFQYPPKWAMPAAEDSAFPEFLEKELEK